MNTDDKISYKYSIIEAPSNLGLKDTGVDLLPEVLLSCGLADRLSADLAEKIKQMPYDKRRDSTTGLLNTKSVAQYSKLLAHAVNRVLSQGKFPLVLGGDCSILLGILLALHKCGRFGLFFADGHADFYQPEANINGEVASSELALATGHGPIIIEGYEKLIFEEDVVVYGFRDEEEQHKYGSQSLPASTLALNLASIRSLGITNSVKKALNVICRDELYGFWLHLDADVLSDEIMPAVDYRLPDGLNWKELVTILRMIRASGRVVGLDITIYNPRLDPDCSIARNFVDALAEGLEPS